MASRSQRADADVSRAHRIKAEQEAHVKTLTPRQLLDEIWERVAPVLTHQRGATYMRIPVDYEHDDDAYVSLRIEELRDRVDRFSPETLECHRLDTPEHVFFYENDFYPLSNFSAFCIRWRDQMHFTSEHAYHWARFDLPDGAGVLLQDCVTRCSSAHEAFRFAQENKSKQRPDWDAVKVDTMREILRTKVRQHEYVRRKLLATGDRELIEDSWRDDFWGWGPNRDGQNMLGKLWMEIRAELRESAA